MEELFELLTEKGGTENELVVRIGIRMKVSGFDAACPVTATCRSYDALKREVQGIRNGLDLLLARAERMFQGSGDRLVLAPDLPAAESWKALSGMNEKDFMDAFNGLEEEKRREVAEYILSKCNVFSGNGLIFSERYEEESALVV